MYFEVVVNSVSLFDDIILIYVLGVKVLVNDVVLIIIELVMWVCGGVVFFKYLFIECVFCDVWVGLVMVLIVDVFYDFYGRVVIGLLLF